MATDDAAFQAQQAKLAADIAAKKAAADKAAAEKAARDSAAKEKQRAQMRKHVSDKRDPNQQQGKGRRR